MSKYKAKRVLVTEDGTMFTMEDIKKYNLQVEGIKFDSKMEAEYYLDLLQSKQAGIVRHFEIQPKFILQEKPKITYIADFHVYWENGTDSVIDIKGMETQAFRVKKKLFESKYPHLQLQVLTKKGKRWVSLDQVKKEKAAERKALRALLKRLEGAK